MRGLTCISLPSGPIRSDGELGGRAGETWRWGDGAEGTAGEIICTRVAGEAERPAERPRGDALRERPGERALLAEPAR